ncbi:MAG: DNA glycosylase [Armatimonadota bacterium]|nr:DNA glycosylase [Armatimonadota bacterium]
MSPVPGSGVLTPARPQRAAFVAVAPPYDLRRTLVSGQCFRWTVTADGAHGVVGGALAYVWQRDGGLEIAQHGSAAAPEHLVRHLGADQPLLAIEATLARDAVIRRLLPYTSGIALMRQDPWECLVSFVISAFNNIPKIQMSVRALARRFGQRVAPGSEAWTFPSPERLAEASDAALRRCVLGYRAPYLRALARLVARGDIDLPAIAARPFDEARQALLALPGVGEKVADCVLLFGFGRHEAFPVDVWVQRAVEQWYRRGRTTTPRDIRAWARDRFGVLAGYAQQHLFAGAREAGRARGVTP